MRPEDQERILADVERRVVDAYVGRARARGLLLEDVLAESLYYERHRLRDERPSKTRDRDTHFWDGIQRGLRHASEDEQQALLRQCVRHYVHEISGHFDPRVYRVATRLLPPALNLLLNAVSPTRILRARSMPSSFEEAVVIQGEAEALKRLHELGTVMLVPTHVSNIDSIIAGYALYRLGLPPFVYGAGLNLFSNPLLGFFMHNLGAYTVDRKKRDPLYKEVLKDYATRTLELGYDTLFFPGGTRSRSGAIEKHLKLGLLGTSVGAYVENLRRGRANPKIFVVPCTFSSPLVLEAETLIEDFLKEVGKSRYIIEDDESSKPRRVLDFMSKLLSLESKVYVTISPALDPFGNRVGLRGESLDPRGRTIDDRRYLWVNGEVAADPERDAEYTRELGERIAEAFERDNVVHCTNITARAIFGLLRARNPNMNLLRLIRTGGVQEDLELHRVHQETGRVLAELKSSAALGRIRLAHGLESLSPEEVVSEGLRSFAIYHARPAATRRGDRVVPVDRALLFYYQNRIEGPGLERTGAVRAPAA